MNSDQVKTLVDPPLTREAAAAPVTAPAPPADPSTGDRIEILLADSGGNKIHFKLKAATPLSRVFASYAQRQGSRVDVYRFLYDGKRVDENDTPRSLNMENGDVIDVMVPQTGGGDGSERNDEPESSVSRSATERLLLTVPYHVAMRQLAPGGHPSGWISLLAMIQHFGCINIRDEEGCSVAVRYDASSGAYSCGRMSAVFPRPIQDHAHWNACTQLSIAIREAMLEENSGRARRRRDLFRLSAMLEQTSL